MDCSCPSYSGQSFEVEPLDPFDRLVLFSLAERMRLFIRFDSGILRSRRLPKEPRNNKSFNVDSWKP